MQEVERTYINKLNEIDTNFVSTERTLKDITENLCLFTFLNEITENKSWIVEVANKSYQHDNGFEKLTVFSGKNFNLRFHIYWNNNSQVKPNIHDHRWDFSSKILAGGYVSELYEIMDYGIEKELYHYYSKEKLEGEYSLYHKGKVYIRRIESTTYKQSDINQSKAGEIHSILYSKIEPTITLFITSKYKIDFARVLTDNFLNNQKIKSKSMSVSEIKSSFHKMLKIIN